MATFVIRRLFQSIIIIFLVTITVFLTMRILPGDPIYMLYTPNQVQALTEEQMVKIRHEAGLDKPLMVQYFTWMGGIFRGDLGQSILHKTKVTDEIAKRLPITAHLGVLSFIIGIVIGVPMGVISAVRRGTWLDTLVTTAANFGITIPVFWLGIMLIFLFAIRLDWLPVMGYTSPAKDFWMNTRQVIMPIVCLAIWPIAGTARQTRSSMLEVLRQDYIRTAWSKGLRERAVIIKHALKNGLIPVLTLAGMGIGTIVGGTVLIEQVFNIPGMGRLAVDAIFAHDYAFVQGVTLIITVTVILANLLVDISYGLIDPRIRFN
jgi:peptide/nickel transport system permease protein